MRKQSIATTRRSIPLPSKDRRIRLGVIRRVADRLSVAIGNVWRETTEAHERIFSRPWEQEGPLRWQRDAGGPKLLGTAIELNENEPDTLRPPQ